MTAARESRPTEDREATKISAEGPSLNLAVTSDTSREHSSSRRPQVRAKRAPSPFPETSREAYENARTDANAVRAAILELLSSKPMTDDELYLRYCSEGLPLKSRQRIATARCELVKQERVCATGERRPSLMGNPSQVWEIVNKGAES